MSNRDVHVDAALTNLSIAYNPTGFIADEVSPIIPVNFESDKYWEWNRADSFRDYEDLRADGSEAKEIDIKATTQTYSADEYALKSKVTDRERKNADSVLKPELTKTKRVKTALLTRRERRVATAFTTSGNYASGNKVQKSGSSQWNNGSYAGNPIDDIDTGIEAVRKNIGMLPNTIIIPYSVALVFKNNAKVIDLLKYTHDDLLEGLGLPKTIRGLRLLCPGAIRTTSNPGAGTTTVADIWGKHVIIAYVNPETSIDSISFAYTFRAQQFETRKWREESRKSDFVETSYIEDNKIVSNVAGYFIETVIA